jgi:LAO/AO transport system kinase
MDNVRDLVERARAGEPRAVARLISWVEDGSPALAEVMSLIADRAGSARVIGVTGPPGVGKSTMTSALVRAWRERGLRVGVIAVDPTSPFSGGALLGDRIRMHDHATDPGVFIRSMASRGHLGGLAATTPQAVRILEAAGCDVVIVETVGVGQSEVEVASTADSTLVLLAPGMGDGIQAAKAGILEIGDVLSVNKADRDGASSTARELSHMLGLADRPDGAWVPRVVTSVASRGDIDAVLEALDEHARWLADSGILAQRRRRRAAEEVLAIAMARIRDRWVGSSTLDSLAEEVAKGERDPFAAAEELRRHLD